MTIRHWDSNPRPSEYESPPVTTRPGLPPFQKACYPTMNLSLHFILKRWSLNFGSICIKLLTTTTDTIDYFAFNQSFISCRLWIRVFVAINHVGRCHRQQQFFSPSGSREHVLLSRQQNGINVTFSCRCFYLHLPLSLSIFVSLAQCYIQLPFFYLPLSLSLFSLTITLLILKVRSPFYFLLLFH